MSKPNLQELLKEATKDMLSADSLKVISEAFETQVEAEVTSRLEARQEIVVREALERQDAEYTAKLESLLEAIDADHTAKLEKIVQRIDENHAAKLNTIIERYNKETKAAAEAYKTKLVEKISRYLDLRLEQAIPTEQLTEAVNNTRAKRIIHKIREAVALDETFVTGEIRAALEDGKRQIDEAKAKVTQLQESVRTLTEQSNKYKTTLLLERKTAGLPKEKRDYVMKALGNKSEQFITENFNFVVDMFDRKETEERETLKESASAVTIKEQIDQPVITESVEPDVSPLMQDYVNGLQG